MKQKFTAAIMAAVLLALGVLGGAAMAAEGDTEPAYEPLSITTTSLPRGRAGEAYSAKLQASGGSGEYEFSIVKGRLRSGMALLPDGTLSGTPDSGGSNNITFCVTDGEGNTATKRITVRIDVQYVTFTVRENYYQYDGKEHTAKLIPDRSDITEDDFTVSYSGSPSQSRVGSYSISVRMTIPGYSVRAINTPLVISRATADMRLNGLTVDFDGEAHAIEPSIEPAELIDDVTVTYTGMNGTSYGPSSAAPSGSGTYRVSAALNNENYERMTRTATLNIVAPTIDFSVSGTEYTYDGEAHRATVEPTGSSNNIIPEFSVTYDNLATTATETLTEVSEAGSYRIRVALDDANYAVGTMTEDILTINPRVVDFDVTDTEKKYSGGGQRVTVKARLAEGVPEPEFTVSYDALETTEVERLSEVTAVGSYAINIELSGTNYELGTISADTVTVSPRVVNFTVSGTEHEYDGAEYRATVTPELAEGESAPEYSVTYDNAATDEVEALEAVTAVGSYKINIAFSDPNCSVGTVSAETVTVSPRVVNFTVSGTEHEYDGTKYRATVTPELAEGESAPEYSVTYDNAATDEVEALEAVTAVGSYKINIAFSDPNCSVGTVSAETVTVSPRVVNFTVSGTEHEYDGAEHRATVTPELAEGESAPEYSVTYDNTATDELEALEAVTAAGNYLISIKFSDENIAAGELAVKNLVISRKKVNFIITNNEQKHYAPLESYAPDISPSEADFTGYTVSYTPEEGGEAVSTVTEPGVYTISIEITDDNYELGEVSAESFKVLIMHAVSFEISGNSEVCRPGETEYGAVITPSIEGFDSYTVSYTPEGGEAVSAVTEPGTYTISIALTAEDYEIGEITGETTFTLTNPLTLTVAGAGNSIAARLSEEEKAEFAENHIYSGLHYSPAAWGEGENLDEDENAYFIFGLAAEELAGLTASAVYADGSAEQVSASVGGTAIEDWRPTEAGVYEISYTARDKYTNEEKTAARKIVYLPGRFADVNGDRNINAGDANALKIIIEAGVENANKLLLYRICDVNCDGTVDENDVNAILNRMRTPISGGFYQGW